MISNLQIFKSFFDVGLTASRSSLRGFQMTFFDRLVNAQELAAQDLAVPLDTESISCSPEQWLL